MKQLATLLVVLLSGWIFVLGGLVGSAQARSFPHYHTSACGQGTIYSFLALVEASTTSHWTHNPQRCQGRPEIKCVPAHGLPKFERGRWVRRLSYRSRAICPYAYAMQTVWVQWRPKPGAHIGHKQIWSRS